MEKAVRLVVRAPVLNAMNNDINIKREILTDLSRFSFCKSRLSLKDLKVLAYQMTGHAFSKSLVSSVARRCAWGNPQVLTCYPVLRGTPFPTTFWLTCPYLARKCGTLETEGAITELEKLLSEDESGYRRYNSLYALVRLSLLNPAEKDFMQLYKPKMYSVIRGAGIGGIRKCGKPTVKCIHLQTAAMLALGTHPAGKWLRKRLGELSCPDCRCTRDC